MTDICAAIGRIQLKKIFHFNDSRMRNASFLSDHINHPDISTPTIMKDCSHVFHQYVIRVKNGRRDNLASYLSEHGIGSAIHYPIPVHEQPVFSHLNNPTCPVSSQSAQEVLSLPVYPGLSETELKYICDVINRWS